ncbi:MAG TPA: type II toxin-antitoxin system HicA family toxin [Alphaproteobacteria bacterium]|nr:type II toxin-antitoxin system HicA family toxin [Alphaproteobacteria bacterium]
MAGVDKLVERFKRCPADFTWNELVRLLGQFGYVETKKSGGSRRKFKCEGLPSISLHKPHPGSIVKKYALEDVREVLESAGLI